MNIQNNIKSPCMGCNVHSITCHDNCESYTSYKETCASIRQGRNDFNKARGIAVESANRQKKCRVH